MADVMRYEKRMALTFKLDELVREEIASTIMVVTSELLPQSPSQIIDLIIEHAQILRIFEEDQIVNIGSIELKSVRGILDDIKRGINLARVINKLKTTGPVHKGFSARSVREDRDSS